MIHDIETTRRALAEVLENEPDVIAAYHFGSTFDGTAHDDSDFDVGVLFCSKVKLRRLVRLEATLDQAIPHTADLVDARRAGPFVSLDVIRGDRFFCRDEVAADEFDLYVLSRAGDLAYYEFQRREILLGTPIGKGTG